MCSSGRSTTGQALAHSIKAFLSFEMVGFSHFSSSPLAIRASPESGASVEMLVIPSAERPVAGSLLQMSRRLVGPSTINTYIQNNVMQTFSDDILPRIL